MNAPTLLITGATGTVGSALTRRLRAAGGAPLTLSSRAGAADRQADFSDLAALTRAFDGVHTLFLLLPLAPGKLDFARNAVRAAQAAGVRHIVRSSGAGADAASPAAIAVLQGRIDQLVVDSGLPHTLLQPSGFMQNWLGWRGEAMAEGVFRAPHGQGAMAVIDAEDIAAAAAVVLADPAAHAGRRYTLTGGQALTDAQMVAAIAEASGRGLRYEDVPEAVAREAMLRQGMPADVADWLMSLHAIIKQGWAAGVSDDFQRLTGRAPRRFTDFVREHAATWQ